MWLDCVTAVTLQSCAEKFWATYSTLKYYYLCSPITHNLSHNFVFSELFLFCRFQDFAREELLYLLYLPKTKLTVTSLWATSLCTVCALPWPASSFCSPPSRLVSVAAKTHVQLFKMGDCLLVWNGIHIFRDWGSFACVTWVCLLYWWWVCNCLFFRFWFFKFLILIGITVGAFFIPDGTFHAGTNMLC